MSDALFIRTLYKPCQPTEDAAGKGKLFYKEYIPCSLLQPYIHCFWELKTTERLAGDYSYRVVADGCIDLLMDNNQFNGMLIAGIADTAFDIPMEGELSYFGIRFLPGGINHFFRFAAGSIANQMIAAENVLDKELIIFSSLLFEEKEIVRKMETAASFLLTKLVKMNVRLHPALAASLFYILPGNSDAAVETKAAGWISPRQLRRLFNDHIGCSPKLFSRIVRFQQTLHAMQYEQKMRRQNTFYDYGYFDQSHFIKEFKTFYGQTPSSVYLSLPR